jgi:aspartate/methionine/tyrosine aminotransferase
VALDERATAAPRSASAPGQAGPVSEFFTRHLAGAGAGPGELDALIGEYVAFACGPRPEPGGPGAAPPGPAALDLASPQTSRAVIGFTKRLFNYYFRDDLYAPHRTRDYIVLSSGSTHEPTFGLSPSMKRCLDVALSHDWYGYSDSRGRVNARQAVVRLENYRLGMDAYSEDSVALTLGGTFSVSCVIDYLSVTMPGGHAVCAIPNYPPLVESVARKMPARLVGTQSAGDVTRIGALAQAINDDTRVVLLQSVTNPTGLPVSEADLEDLIRALGPRTYLILDEAHECLGQPRALSRLRAHPQVVRVASLSKQLSVPGMKVGWILAARDFVDDYYEYASTVYGGPASFFYSLVDVYMTFELIRCCGAAAVARQELAGVAERYEMSLAEASAWYEQYRREQGERTEGFLRQREYAVGRLAEAGFAVTRPRYSVNCSLDALGQHSSYGFFRDVLEQAGVSVYPNVLAFDLADASVRITMGREPGELSLALDRLSDYARQHRDRP